MTKKKPKKYKVRFNLGRGENYMKWKVTNPKGEVEYYDPNQKQLFMWRCQLKNNRKTAERIFNGEDKSVCSWVTCEEFAVKPYPRTWRAEDYRHEIKYNPRVNPFWSKDGIDVDNKEVNFIFSSNKQLFTN